MVTIYKVDNETTNKSGVYVSVDMRGLSTDVKPTEYKDKKIANGSSFLEINTGKLYLYDLDSETWKEI